MIEELTPEQDARLEAYFQKWLKIGLAVGPTNRKEAERLIDEVYAADGLPPPAVKIWAGSPISGCLEACKRVDKVTRRSSQQKINESISRHLGNACYGSHDAEWLGFYDYMQSELKIDCGELSPMMRIAEVCGWFFPYDDLVILTDLPESQSFDAEGRLHSSTGPALRYSDGEEFYFFHDVEVPKNIITDPSSISVASIDAEKNAEVRRVMMEIFGFEKFLTESGAKVVHQDKFGELMVRPMQDDEPLVMVRVLNSTPEPDGSSKYYYLGVHPELRPILANDQFGEPQAMTARNAVASTFGLTGDQYSPEIES